ncbi:MAG: right-handed parallel beta-helix repeat-containing protein [Saprospiraceae bacterium]|nr:right-handed parallel beta-helix repeat-containing protein [Saprospiraceae bacterium]
MYKKISLFFVALCWLVNVSGNTFYVRPTGNDNNSGLSGSLAFRSLQKAANTVIAGDSVLVADSTYAGFDLRTSGTAANPIVFYATGSQVIINRRNPVTTDGINIEGANWIEIRGFRVINQPRAGIRAVLADHITVRYNTCLNNNLWGIFTGFTDDFLAEYNECAYSVLEHGIYVSNSSDRAILRYNISHHNRAAGFHFNGDISQGEDGINHDPQVYNNILYRNGLGGGSAINMDGNQNALIYNNLLYDNHATGIGLYQIDGGSPSFNAKIYHNTIVQDDTSRWCILIIDGSSGATIRNNILINQHSFRGAISIDAASLTGFTSDYNILTNRITIDDGNSILDSAGWKSLGQDTHSFFAPSFNNLFVNFSMSDFKLAINSKAKNFGINGLNPSITNDLLGMIRPSGPAPDAGAYEALSGALPLRWLVTRIERTDNPIQITGTLSGDEQIQSVFLEEWNYDSGRYDHLDSKPLTLNGLSSTISFFTSAHPGIHLYRLTAWSAQGQYYSSKTLRLDKNSGDWKLFPNPAADFLIIKGFNNQETISASIIDVKGRWLKTVNTIAEPLSIRELPKGQYRLLIRNGTHILGQTWFQKI